MRDIEFNGVGKRIAPHGSAWLVTAFALLVASTAAAQSNVGDTFYDTNGTQTPTTADIVTTASLASAVSFTVTDNTIECGTIDSLATTCNTTTAGSAAVNVVSNADWVVTVQDAFGTNPAAVDQVTLYNLAFNNSGDGTFVVGIAATPSGGNPTSGTPVTLTTTTIPSTAPDSLEVTDGSGVFEGVFQLTITSQ